MSGGIGAFAGRCLLWLAPCYALWYFAGPLWAWISGGLARVAMKLLRPWLVTGMDVEGHAITLATSVELRVQGGVGLFLAEVDGGIYTHGLALFCALMLAARAPLRRLALGALVLLPFQAWGVVFDLLSQLVRLGPEARSAAGLSSAWANPIALGYQAGSLILPSLAPVATWAWLNRSLVAALARGAPPIAQREPLPPPGAPPDGPIE